MRMLPLPNEYVPDMKEPFLLKIFGFFLSCVPYAASFSGLSIFDCPFGFQ